MKEFLQLVYKHPIWTLIFGSAIVTSITRLIYAIRGKEKPPEFSVKIGKDVVKSDEKE